jgi:cobyrinic acid a,c-diamide synthase
MNVPRIVIAGTHSGCGKTTIASGLMTALADRGLKVQPFKVGPDFIDPTHHTAICGRHSRNLDPFMMGEDGVLSTFGRACAGADIAVIEGVMGLFDGLEGSDTSSTAHVSRILTAPVALVVDVRSMSRSANALIHGFRSFDPAVDIAGVIFNRVGSPGHRRMIEASLDARPLGWVPKSEGMEIKSRHLGLQMAGEVDVRERQGEVIAESVCLDEVVRIAAEAPPLPDMEPGPGCRRAEDVSIGVAMDAAFCFYYRDNLDSLEAAGARLEYFSPIDDRLPEVDGLYFGGGYPELYAAELSASRCREAVRKAVDRGMPAYAECGGLMYLARGIALDREYPMAGALPARAEMTGKIQALGYIKGETVAGGAFPPGLGITGHEFHYSRVECDGDARFAYRLSRGRGIADGRDGLSEHNATGAYTHAYFTREMAASIVGAARLHRDR